MVSPINSRNGSTRSLERIWPADLARLERSHSSLATAGRIPSARHVENSESHLIEGRWPTGELRSTENVQFQPVLRIVQPGNRNMKQAVNKRVATPTSVSRIDSQPAISDRPFDPQRPTRVTCLLPPLHENSGTRLESGLSRENKLISEINGPQGPAQGSLTLSSLPE